MRLFAQSSSQGDHRPPPRPPATDGEKRRLHAAERVCQAAKRFVQGTDLGADLRDLEDALFQWERVKHEEGG